MLTMFRGPKGFAPAKSAMLKFTSFHDQNDITRFVYSPVRDRDVVSVAQHAEGKRKVWC